MLEIVGESLQRNGIRTVMCKNRGKDFQQAGPIEVFRNSADVRVLLLPLALGAEGLDLIVASHVFILEPLLNMQQEMQAVNRIYRIGQTRSTMIHKYAVKGTVEERILNYQQSRDNYDEQSDDKQPSSSGASVGKSLKRDDGNLAVGDIVALLGIDDSK
ncbi:DEAD/DEAH box helicase [archaeon]|nr:MAG: DEAD/DEAH box helicase [archaeon]